MQWPLDFVITLPIMNHLSKPTDSTEHMQIMVKIGLWLIGITTVLTIAAGVAWWVVIRGVETPDYQVVIQDGRLELRDYPALRIAEITRSGDRETALRSGFRPLAGYIFAREREGERIAMTAPVTQTSDEGAQWRVAFIMPKQYSLDDLPTPTDADLTLREMPAQLMAAIRFSGRADQAAIDAQEALLADWLNAQQLTPIAAPIYAYYDDPMTPGFLRRNEILIPVHPSD